KLSKRHINGAEFYGSDGLIENMVVADELVLGGLKRRRPQFLVLPRKKSKEGYDGVFAPDYLASYDADFDFGNQTLNLFSQDHCKGKVVYWTTDYAQIPFRIDDTAHILLPVTLDGKEMTGLVDTGADETFLRESIAKGRFGLDSGSQQVEQVQH